MKIEGGVGMGGPVVVALLRGGARRVGPLDFDLQLVRVYCWCMSRTNIDIDDKACTEVMRRYRLATKREAVNLALRTLAAEPLTVDEARALRGTGWEGDLDDMRTGRTS
jgi:Arc/MetJ family transcription regulator